MTKYREIIRLAQPNLKLSQEQIAASCNASKGTVNKVLKAAKEHQWIHRSKMTPFSAKNVRCFR